MKKILLSITMLTIAFSVNARLDSNSIAAKLKAMEIDWNNSALEKDHGVKTLSYILADDYYQWDRKTRKQQNKAELLLSAANTKDTTISVVNGPMTVHFYGENVATVIGSHVDKVKDSNGKVVTKTHHWVDTYMERNGKWQCITSGGDATND